MRKARDLDARGVLRIPILQSKGSGRMTLACYDCGLSYAHPAWVEAVVPHDIWNNYLSPTGGEGGILCVGCMAKRAVAAGLSDVPVKLTAGPFTASVDSLPKGQDGEAGLVRSKGSAVPEGQTPLPPLTQGTDHEQND